MWVCLTSVSTRSIVRRMMSKARRRSPVWEAIFLEQNWIAVGLTKGVKSEEVRESEGKLRDLSLLVMTEAI